MKFPEYLSSCQNWVNCGLARILTNQATPNDRIREAMTYSTMASGKRVRPLLVRAVCEALGGKAAQALPAACAIELVHTYSLIHDDLPAMDDDDLRRGRPTCHKAFDEATAILTGDALLTLAFEVVADHSLLPEATRLRQSVTLARASGCKGMIEGQARDMQATGHSLNLADLQALHEHKTGALIRASCAMGAQAAMATPEQLKAIDQYAQAIGLAFQVQDDILDVTASTELMGKRQGADEALGKNTYVSLLGLDAAQQQANELGKTALLALDRFAGREQTLWLRELANYIVHRDH